MVEEIMWDSQDEAEAERQRRVAGMLRLLHSLLE